tara:strand:+ start:455 stop:601 length:147 start_codon:yes stop_codon:yes gene_type:complete
MNIIELINAYEDRIIFLDDDKLKVAELKKILTIVKLELIKKRNIKGGK